MHPSDVNMTSVVLIHLKAICFEYGVAHKPQVSLGFGASCLWAIFTAKRRQRVFV